MRQPNGTTNVAAADEYLVCVHCFVSSLLLRSTLLRYYNRSELVRTVLTISVAGEIKWTD